MGFANAETSSPRRPLRLWPGVSLLVVQWLVRFALPVVVPDALPVAVLGGLVGGLAILAWWAFFSRAAVLERWGAVVLVVVAVAATRPLLHESMATAGMGVLFFVYVAPVISLAVVGWAVLTRNLADGPRRAALVVSVVVACGAWTLVRTGGITGDADSEFAWRWAATPEDRLLARSGDEPTARPPAASNVDPVESTVAWPGFRGPDRDGVVHGVRIGVDWSSAPPVEIWRRSVGPGWSSFAVDSGRLYTQEQRGEDEVVSCYDLRTGEPLWRHGDPVRFWESNAGAGPRGTPTVHGARVYALGATGLLNALDADDGSVVWSRDAAADTGAELPTWGFSGSPLVVEDLVLVAAAGRLAAYDLEDGGLRWLGPDGGSGYSSPHRMTLDGVPQILLLSEAGLTGVAAEDGTVLWEHPWPGYPIVQPARTADGDVLVAVTERSGTRRLGVTRDGDGWTVEERWTSIGLKPYFNDFVVHEGHAYGFDGRILACIDVDTGERRWKGGRFGNGQMMLLPEQDLLLVLSEKGELALVGANPDGFTELARFAVLDDKTWNHPVLVDDVLLVRNDREMAAFRLPAAGPSAR